MNKPTAPTAVSLHKILQPKFPLSIQDSLTQWRNRNDLESAEKEVFKCVGINSNTQNSRSLNVEVDIDNKYFKNGRQPIYMNEFELKQSNSKGHVVLVHGYGASKGFFYKNFKDIVSVSGKTLHALDWLGYGRSTRVAVNLPRFPNRKEGVHYAEDFFLSSFESWRIKRNIPKFTFVAHSLGAYLACAYASKFPEMVEKIILVSPASVNRTPLSIKPHELPKNTDISPEMGPVPKAPAWFNWMWEQHWSPFALVRETGVLGPKFTSGWTSRRFAGLDMEDQIALQRYAYVMFNAPGSGEYMLNYLLACGGAGRYPLLERLDKLECDTMWMYGDHDWMPFEAGNEAARRLRSKGLKAEVKIAPNSGHHLYLDNVDWFKRALSL